MKVICFGDSNTYGYDPRGAFGGRYEPENRWVDRLAKATGWQVENWGENGREVPKAPVAFPDDTDLLIVMLGTNDLLQFWTPEDTARKMREFLLGLTLDRRKILLATPPVMRLGAWVEDQELIDDSIRLGECYHALAEEMQIRHLDTSNWNLEMAFDGVHMTEVGNEKFANELVNTARNVKKRKMQPIVDEIDCISVANMRESDAYTIENLVPSLELMHRAAMGIFRAGEWKGRVAVVAGSGNNGGDGFALACILRESGFDCRVFTLSSRLSEDSAFYCRKAMEMGVEVTAFSEGCLEGMDMVVDCLLGTGFQGTPRDNYRNAIQEINACAAWVVSADINSGMNGDTGEGDCIVNSDLTVTIGYVKTGLVTPNAGRYIKQLRVAPIGIRLVREELKIVSPDDPRSEERGYLPCPAWLDMVPVTLQWL